MVDAEDPRHQILSRFQSKIKHQPLIPLGVRGKLRGVDYEAIGYMRRRVRYYGVDYEWSETLLWNPYHGYQWLLEYAGQWSLFQSCIERPEEGRR